MVFRVTAHDIYAKSVHDPYANSLWTLTTSMPTVLMAYARIANDYDTYANSAKHKGQAALWVTNGCTSMHVKTNYYIVYAHGHRQL